MADMVTIDVSKETRLNLISSDDSEISWVPVIRTQYTVNKLAAIFHKIVSLLLSSVKPVLSRP